MGGGVEVKEQNNGFLIKGLGSTHLVPRKGGLELTEGVLHIPVAEEGINWEEINRKRGSKGTKTWAREWKGICMWVQMMVGRRGGMLGFQRDSQAPVPCVMSSGDCTGQFSEPRLGQVLHTVSWPPAREMG